MLPKNFKPNKTYNLIRTGSDNDGGYLVEKNSMKNSKSLISLGLGNDWKFELDFLLLNNDAKIYAFDLKINKTFWFKNILKNFEKFLLFKKKFQNFCDDLIINLKYINFLKNKRVYYFQEKIGIDKNTMSISDIIKKYNLEPPYFLKIDIEGCEYRLLDDLFIIQDQISGFVIEFHNVDLHFEKIENFILKTNLTLVHVHPNNADYISKDNDPITIEMTFAKKPIPISNNISLPHPLDQKSREKNPDHPLFFLE